MMKRFTLTLMAAAAMLLPSIAQAQLRTVYTAGQKLDFELLADKSTPKQLYRTLYAGYNSLCLPVSLTPNQLSETGCELQIERLAKIKQEGDVLKLYFIDCTKEGIQAGMPYIVFSPSFQPLRVRVDEYSTELKSITMTDDTGENQVTFGSTWEAFRQEGLYGIPAQQDTYELDAILVRTDELKSFLPTRCCFDWTKSALNATQMEIVHITSMDAIDATSIETLKAKNSTVDIYDVQGKLVASRMPIRAAMRALKAGVYVVNGQKIGIE